LSRHGLESANHRGQVWFNGLMHGVLGSKERVDRIIDNFKNNPDCGMVGAKKNNNFAVNLSCMNEIFSWVNLKTNTDGHFFVGGTIFWINNDILKKYLTDDVIDKILEISPPGYVHEPSINHAMERIFGSLVYVENKQIYIL
jgi:lipopolysaccharide biosynthesis protein